MLKITPIKTDHGLCLQLDGRIAAEWVGELRHCWRALHRQVVEITLEGVEHIDSKGCELLKEMHASGVRVLGARGAWVRPLVEEVMGKALNKNELSSTPQRSGHTLPILALLLLLATFAPLRVFAQSAEPLPTPSSDGTYRLTLHQAVRLALKQGPEAQLAAISLATQHAEKSVALAGLLPQASAMSMIGANKYNTAATGMKIPGFPSVTGPYEIFGAGAGFTMPLFDLTLWRKYQANSAGVRAASAGAQSVREQVVTLVASQYLSCQKAQADVTAASSRVELAETLQVLADHMLETGAGAEIDSLRAHVQSSSEKQKLIIAQAVLQTNLDALARLLNLDFQQHVEIADELKASDESIEKIALLVDKALANRPEMAVISARSEAQHRAKQAARESRLPTIGATGMWGYLGQSVGSSTPSYSYAIAAYLPLFTGGKIRAENTKADLELQKIDREKEQTRQRIIFEVRSARTMLEASQNEVKVAQEALQLARRELEQARDRFAAGATNNVEVSMAQDALAHAEDGLNSALYREQQARADLAHAIGSSEAIYGR